VRSFLKADEIRKIMQLGYMMNHTAFNLLVRVIKEYKQELYRQLKKREIEEGNITYQLQ
jgi:hypothetical protein